MRPGRVAMGAVGLAACATMAIPLTQRLSIDLMQLQLRSKFIDERQSLVRIAGTFGMTPTALAEVIGLGPIRGDEAMQPLAELASVRGVPINTAKQRIAETVMPRQFAGRSILAGIGLNRRERDAEARR